MSAELEGDSQEQQLAVIEAFKKNNPGLAITAEEFDKDQDDNGHIDLIYSLANCRARNYSLAAMDWLQVTARPRLRP